MTGLDHFKRLKQEILSQYRKHFPYFTGDWKSFSSQDIQNLIGLIEDSLRETVSEKWIYTHLKPEQNDKLPRKDMLDIFSRFCGYSGWDEFVFEPKKVDDTPQPKNFRGWFLPLTIGGILILTILIWQISKSAAPEKTHKVKVTDQFTGEPVNREEVQVFQVDSMGEKPAEVKNGEVVVPKGKPAKLVVKSPFYKTQSVVVNPSSDSTVVRIKPDDYAMMLKAFLKSDIKDWKTRKLQLDKILSDDLEVIVMLKDNLGAEYFGKKEFSDKVIIPTPSLKKLKIIELNHDRNKKISFVRLAE